MRACIGHLFCLVVQSSHLNGILNAILLVWSLGDMSTECTSILSESMCPAAWSTLVLLLAVEHGRLEVAREQFGGTYRKRKEGVSNPVYNCSIASSRTVERCYCSSCEVMPREPATLGGVALSFAFLFSQDGMGYAAIAVGHDMSNVRWLFHFSSVR